MVGRSGASFAVTALLALGCGAGDEPAPVPAPVPCAGHDPLPDGSCLETGIAPEGCGAGFVPDGDLGCTAVLPESSCAKGTMAVPGESVCREVAPCGRGTWGDIPIEASTEHVDQAYTGSDSDGSAERPWARIADAFADAAPGAIIAVAAGEYAESLVLKGKTVRLWGRCPSLVTVRGTDPVYPAILVGQVASQTEIRDLGMSGVSFGFIVDGSEGVVADRVWIHDTGKPGVQSQTSLGPASVTISRSLVEDAVQGGVLCADATVQIDASVIRNTFTKADGTLGRGVELFGAGKLTISGSLVDNNFETGIHAGAGELVLMRSVVRGTKAGSTGLGVGVNIQSDPAAATRTSGVVQASLVLDSVGVGINFAAADGSIENTVVRSTAVDGSGANGDGVRLGVTAGGGSQATVSSLLVEGSHSAGVFVHGSTATLDRVAVRDTLPGPYFGRGIDVSYAIGQALPASAVITSALVQRSVESGITVLGAEATIERTMVRDTVSAPDGFFGRGIMVQEVLQANVAAKATVRNSRVDDNQDVGVFVAGSHLDMESSVVTDTRVNDLGNFGDGVAIGAFVGPASARIVGCRIENSARVALSNFSADVTMGDNRFWCQSIDFDGETYEERPFSFDDLGGNACGCGDQPHDCKLVSTDLAPPTQVGE